MTSEEALDGIKELQRIYEQQYKGRDLNPIWPDLLECSVDALTKAIGEMRMIYKRLPGPDLLLQKVQRWQLRLNEQEGESGRDAGAEYLQLLSGHVAGRITETEYVAMLYALADKYKRPGFAQMARERQEKLAAA